MSGTEHYGKTCFHCGYDYAIHHFETKQCPKGGEALVGKKQEWLKTIFVPLAPEPVERDLLKKNEIESQSYTLRDENGHWLAQVVLTSDGMFASVTDYGNFSYAWRNFGTNFKEFLCGLSKDYFANKMNQGFAYVLYSKKVETAAKKFSEIILPALQRVLKNELGI